MNLHRAAFEAIYDEKSLLKGTAQECHARRNAALCLAHHLRSHGLSATMGYGLAGDENTKAITSAFIGALHNVCPIQGHDAISRAQTLRDIETEAVDAYLLHSRLSLVLADGFSLAAKALWSTESHQ